MRRALLGVDRKNYCQSAGAPRAYEDAPQQIGWNITISAPHMHCRALEELREQLRPGCRALDIGSGSGYLTAAMAALVGATGKAIGIDHIPDLVEWSRGNVKRDGKASLLESGQLQLEVGDGFKGWPARAVRLHPRRRGAGHGAAGAQSSSSPAACCSFLSVPSSTRTLCASRSADGARFTETKLFSVRYVPLTTAAAQLQRM